MATINTGKVLRLLLCILLPPVAVLDKGCGAIAIVTALTLFGWFPGVVAALIFGFGYQPRPRLVEVPMWEDDTLEYDEKPKREFIRLADGELGELREDDGVMPEKRKRDLSDGDH